MKKDNIYESMEKDIINSTCSEQEKNEMLKNVMRLKDKTINIMITGATGCGKSSTINALFDTEVAKVGVGVDPETMEIVSYKLDNLILWDTPGLGDGKEADNRHAKAIIRKLSEVDENGDALIDLVLVILDGSSRDLGTSYELINNVIIPNLGQNKEKRILVAINQAVSMIFDMISNVISAATTVIDNVKPTNVIAKEPESRIRWDKQEEKFVISEKKRDFREY